MMTMKKMMMMMVIMVMWRRSGRPSKGRRQVFTSSKAAVGMVTAIGAVRLVRNCGTENGWVSLSCFMLQYVHITIWEIWFQTLGSIRRACWIGWFFLCVRHHWAGSDIISPWFYVGMFTSQGGQIHFRPRGLVYIYIRFGWMFRMYHAIWLGAHRFQLYFHVNMSMLSWKFCFKPQVHSKNWMCSLCVRHHAARSQMSFLGFMSICKLQFRPSVYPKMRAYAMTQKNCVFLQNHRDYCKIWIDNTPKGLYWSWGRSLIWCIQDDNVYNGQTPKVYNAMKNKFRP